MCYQFLRVLNQHLTANWVSIRIEAIEWNLVKTNKSNGTCVHGRLSKPIRIATKTENYFPLKNAQIASCQKFVNLYIVSS